MVRPPIDWKKVLQGIRAVTCNDPFITIDFDEWVGQELGRIVYLSESLGISFRQSADKDGEHYSIAALLRSYDGMKVTFVLPPGVNLNNHYGIRIYYCDMTTTWSRKFPFKTI